MNIPAWLGWLPFGQVPEMSPQQLNKNLSEFCLVDVRTQPEFNKSHIPGAISIPLHRLTQKCANSMKCGKPIICICLSAHRSKPAVRKFKRAGIPCYELQGGMLAWWKQNLPTETGGQP